MTYEQAYRDREALWQIGPPVNMAQNYPIQADLEAMLKDPTADIAAQCLCSQIEYWYNVGPKVDPESDVSLSFDDVVELYPHVLEVYVRYGLSTHW